MKLSEFITKGKIQNTIIEMYFPDVAEDIKKKNERFQRLLIQAMERGIIGQQKLEIFLDRKGYELDAYKTILHDSVYFQPEQKRSISEGTLLVGKFEKEKEDQPDICVLAKKKDDISGLGMNMLLQVIGGTRKKVDTEIYAFEEK